MMEFTQDWFSNNTGNFAECAKYIPSKESFLEIGCFEGRANTWMLANMLSDKGSMVVADTFEGGVEHEGLDLSELKDRFQQNVDQIIGDNQTLEIIDKPSFYALAELAYLDFYFDFIYVDASHETPDVITDACMAFQLLEPKGVMLFDDYLGGAGVKQAVDAFLETHKDRCKILFVNYQLAIQKV